jgi:hypothetical protein
MYWWYDSSKDMDDPKFDEKPWILYNKLSTYRQHVKDEVRTQEPGFFYRGHQLKEWSRNQ